MSANEFHDSTDCSRADGQPDAINPSVPGTPLLTCPFCGESAVEDEKDDNGDIVFYVYCTYCNGSYYSYTSMKRAIQGWNNRAVAHNETARVKDDE